MTKISTQNMGQLPNVATLKRALRAAAMLDALLDPTDPGDRYYQFEHTSPAKPWVSIGYWRNGSGDHLDAIFGRHGCLIRGFNHEARHMSPYRKTPPEVYPGVLDHIPAEFEDCRQVIHPSWWADTTFCIWRGHHDARWGIGTIDFPDAKDPDGSQWVLPYLDGRPDSYLEHAHDYYDATHLTLEQTVAFFETTPLTQSMAKAINPDCVFQEVLKEATHIGYPINQSDAGRTTNG